jgi:hypothetical protein
MHRAAPVLLALLLAAGAPDGAYAEAPGATASADAARDGAADFDFLIGDWDARLRRLEDPLTGSTHWVEYAGVSRTHKLLGSPANFEEFEVKSLDGSPGRKGQTLRLYDPESREWSLYLLDVDKGRLPLPPVIGRFRNGVGEFYSQEAWKGRTIFVRYQWSHAGRTAHMEQAFSPDGGRSWEVNWIVDMTRAE